MNTVVAILLTYLVHSTIWFGLAYLLQLARGLSSELKVHIWQCAGLAGLISTLIAVCGWAGPISASLGFDPLTINPSLPFNFGASTADHPDSPWSWPTSWPIFAVALWALGAAYQLTRFGLNLHHLAKRMDTRMPIDHPEMINVVRRTARQMGVSRTIRVSTSDAIRSPIALTWREICFPNQLLKDIDEPALKAILGHELCHLRRLDPIALPLFSLIAAVAWPQILWHSFFRYRDLEVERVCDRAGAQVVESSRLMAESLLRVAQWMGTQSDELAVTALHGHHPGIYGRISQLLSSPIAPVGRKQKVRMYLVPITMLAIATFFPQFEARSASKASNFGPEASVNGAIDKAEIRGVVRANIDQIRRCYNQALEIDPTVEGRLSVAFTIGASGTVTTSKLEWSNLENPPLESCIVNKMASWNYPKPENGGKVSVTYPFDLSPD